MAWAGGIFWTHLVCCVYMLYVMDTNKHSATAKSTCAYAEQLVRASAVRRPGTAETATSPLLMDWNEFCNPQHM